MAGGGSTCVIFTDGRIKCWGANVYGLLGLGDEISRGDNPNEMGKNLPFVDLGSGRTVVDLALGGGHACALLDGGQVKCWGGNTFGQLGLGDTLPRGSYPNQMGDKLPVVDLGAGLGVVALAAGRYHTCAIFSDGQIKCWGDNLDNKLGVSGTIPYSLGGKAGEMGDKLPFVNLGAGRTALGLAVGVGHTCALLDTHQIRCWGGEHLGRPGPGRYARRHRPVQSRGRALRGRGLGWPRPQCALLDGGQVECWGRNEFGELGLGDLVNPEPHRSVEMGDNLPVVDLGTGRGVREIYALDGDSCAVLDNATIRCWGLNDYGELGLGNTTPPRNSARTDGDNLPAADPAPPHRCASSLPTTTTTAPSSPTADWCAGA